MPRKQGKNSEEGTLNALKSGYEEAASQPTEEKTAAEEAKNPLYFPVVLAQVVEHLTYQSYKAGKIRYLDVQDANLKLLEAEVIYAQIESSLLNEIAMLDYLNTDKE